VPSVRQAGEADTDEYERLFRDTRAGLWRTLYGFTGGRADVAEEAMAEAFARAIEHADSIRDPLPWIYRTAFRIAAAELKRERVQPGDADPVGSEPRHDLEELMQALRRLSPNQRAAVILHYEADLPTGEVARRMGVSVATVRVHLHRGRKRLRQLLGAEEGKDA
jgi:RNA polymerase sigma-70 factor (ECF subfamily)